MCVPFLWNLPIAFVTAELGSALPSNEGAFVWIQEAWGSRLALISSLLYWLNYTVDTALYPVLMLGYFEDINKAIFTSEWVIVCFPFGAILFVFVLNVLGIDLLADVSTGVTILQNSPFIIILGFSIYYGKINASSFVAIPPGPFTLDSALNIALCFQVVVWSNSGYDAIGSMVEEVKDSQRTIKKSLLLAISMSVATYAFAIVGLIGVDSNYSEWKTGEFSILAQELIGNWFLYVTIAAALIGQFGTFNALLYPCSQQLWALGGEQFLNLSFLQYKTERFNTPVTALAINSFLCYLFTFVPFIALVQINNVLYGFLITLILSSMIRLRYSESGKRIYRPYKMFESNTMVVLVLIWPIIISIFLIVTAIYNAIHTIQYGE